METFNANAFEPIDKVLDKYADFAHIVAMTLLKMRMLADLRMLKSSQAVGQRLPQELVDPIRDNLISPPVASDEVILKKIRDGKSLHQHIATIDSQIDELFEKVDKENEHFWPALLNPGPHLNVMPEYYSKGTIEEVQLALRHNYRSWVETPGAIDFVKARLHR